MVCLEGFNILTLWFYIEATRVSLSFTPILYGFVIFLISADVSNLLCVEHVAVTLFLLGVTVLQARTSSKRKTNNIFKHFVSLQ